MNRWDRHWFGPVSAIRPYLFQKLFMLLIATDAVVLMTERGARYGVDGFNVAHFRWLDAFQPFPTADWYVGVLMLAATTALVQFFAGSTRLRGAILVILYTYAWAMSRHDSYLHHYMASLILMAIVFFPCYSASQLLQSANSLCADAGKRGDKRNPSALPAYGGRSAGALTWYATLILLGAVAYRANPATNTGWPAHGAYLAVVLGGSLMFWRGVRCSALPLTSAGGFRLLGTTVGVIYLYTSLAKCDAQWCSGHTIQQVGRVREVLAPVVNLADSLGIAEATFWSIVATAVIPLELTIAAAYFAAVRQDEPQRVWLRRFCSIGWLLAMGLHLNNEMMGLSIQWFSYYMVFLACFFLLPAGVLWRLGAVVVWPAARGRDFLNAHFTRWQEGSSRTPLTTLVLVAMGAMLAAVFVGDLPGVVWALPLATVVVLAAAMIKQVRGAPERSNWLLTGLTCSGLYFVLLFAASTVRFDYYNLLGKTEQKLLDSVGFSSPSGPSAVNGSPTDPATATHQQKAIAAFQEALRIGTHRSDDHVELLINLGLAHRQVRDYEQAMYYYREVLAIAPDSFLAHYNLGVCQQLLGREEQALESFGRAVEIKSDLSDALVNMAAILAGQKQWDDAIGRLRAARKIEPNANDIQQMIEQYEAERAAALINDAEGPASSQ